MLKKIFILVLIINTNPINADTKNNSSLKVEVKKKKIIDEADQIITNKRMRAESGSLSNISINSLIYYAGGSLEKPFAATRPNITDGNSADPLAAAIASIGVVYRINKLNRVGLSTGLVMAAPFNQTIDTESKKTEQSFKKNQGKLDIYNPTISYTNVNKVKNIQIISAFSFTEVTKTYFRDLGYKGAINLALNTMYHFEGTSFSMGAYLYYSKNLHDLPGNQTDHELRFNPQAEYVINDTFNIRTIIRSNQYESLRETPMSFKQNAVTQSIGLGISVTRDIFLYPNVQIAYQNLQLANTNVGLNANINIF